METVFALPALWMPSGAAGRLNGLSVAKSITLGPTEQGVYLQALSQNVRVTLDGLTNPVATGNDVGFELVALATPYLFIGFPGMRLTFIQVAASAVLQYQPVSLVTRFQ